MDRNELLDMLAGLVADGALTEEEAARLLIAFDDGDLTADDLPMPPSGSADAGADEATLAAALALLILRFGEGVEDAAEEERLLIARRVQDDFEARTAALMEAGLSVRAWHAAALALVREQMLLLLMLATGGRPTDDDLVAFEAAMLDQAAYLQRFAEERAVGEATGDPPSEAQVTARLVLYAGAGYALYFLGSERRAEAGTVYDYIAVDDRGTCTPCLAAEADSPYLPGEGPMPGDVCLGRGRCRCRRVPRFDPATYAALTG